MSHPPPPPPIMFDSAPRISEPFPSLADLLATATVYRSVVSDENAILQPPIYVDSICKPHKDVFGMVDAVYIIYAVCAGCAVSKYLDHGQSDAKSPY